MIIGAASSLSRRRSSTVSTGSPPWSAIVRPATTTFAGPSVPSWFSQPGSPTATSPAILRRDSGTRARALPAYRPPRLGVARPRERRLGPTPLRPRRQQRREQRRSGAVGVLVERVAPPRDHAHE